MKYNEEQVLDILKLVTDQPEVILNKWSNRKDNEPLDLSKYHYPLFLYTFPIVVDGEEVATFTLSELRNTGVDGIGDMIMSKYLTTDVYNKSWNAFSHKTYKHAYLTIKKDFELPEHPEDSNFFSMESTFLDADGKEVKYRISCGYPKIEGLYEQWVDDSHCSSWRTYRFDNDVTVNIEATGFSGWEMGEKINETIKNRNL